MSCSTTLVRTVRKAVSGFSVSVMSVNAVLGLAVSVIPAFMPIAAAAGPVCTPPDSTLISYWKLDEAAAGDSVLDSKGSNHGTAVGAAGTNNKPQPTTAATVGFDNDFARNFDGTDDAISLGSNVGNFSLADNFTVSAWINPALDSQDHAIYGNAWSTAGYLLRVTPANKLRFILIENGSVYEGVDSAVLTPGWHHVVGRWDGTDVKVYVDGVEESLTPVTSGTVTTISTANQTWIGRTPEAGNEKYFKGDIDDVRVYSSALSLADIQRLGSGLCAVDLFTTSMTLGTSGTPSIFNTSVTFTANISGGFGTDGATVDFYDDVTLIGSDTLSSGEATFSTSSLSVGNHPITAVFTADTNNAGSVSTPVLVQVVDKVPTTTSVTSDYLVPFALDTDTITFTATVVGLSPTGTVEFRNSGIPIGNGAVNGAGIATFQTNALAGNGTTHTITAHYSGDGNNEASDSTSIAQLVNTLSTLKVQKTVINDDGGTLAANQFVLKVDGTPVTMDAVVSYAPGTYTVSEDAVYGYAGTISGDCAADGTVTLTYNETMVCTITNDDIAPKLTVTKVVINDNGGLLVVSDFPLFIDATPVTSGVQNTTTIGAHVVSETPSPQYEASIIVGDCDANGNITLAIGDVKSCVITNDDKPAHIFVTKTVVNDNGGTKIASDFTINVSGNNPDQTSFAGSASTDVTIDAGSYDITETPDAGYAVSYSADCSGSILPGETKTCTITNDDIQPLFTVNSVIINDNGGTLTEADFPPFFDGSPVTYGVQFGIDASPVPYIVSQLAQPSMYAFSFSGDCDASGNVTLSVGDVKQCTITNDDIAPKLTIIKKVINNNGGSLQDGDFVLSASGMVISHGIATDLNVGGYVINEIENIAYEKSYSGDCGLTNGFIHLGLGETKTCTITNDDRPRFFDFQDNGIGGGASIQGNGGHRGHGTDMFGAKANFVASFLTTDIAPGAFGGGPEVPLSDDEIAYICSMQRAIPFDASSSFIEWLGGFMAGLMNRDDTMILSALKDPAFCAPKQAAAPVKKADVIIHLDAKGIVVSSNPVWNACVSGRDLTLSLIRSNEDTYVHRQGTVRKEFAMTCRDYHRGDVSMWQHPDHPGLEIELDTKGRLVGGLPAGYIAKRNVSESVATK